MTADHTPHQAGTMIWICVWTQTALTDALAERSKAVAQGAIPQGRGFEPHRRHCPAKQQLANRWSNHSRSTATGGPHA